MAVFAKFSLGSRSWLWLEFYWRLSCLCLSRVLFDLGYCLFFYFEFGNNSSIQESGIRLQQDSEQFSRRHRFMIFHWHLVSSWLDSPGKILVWSYTGSNIGQYFPWWSFVCHRLWAQSSKHYWYVSRNCSQYFPWCFQHLSRRKHFHFHRQQQRDCWDYQGQ